jgi:hypothetical protein
LREPKFRLFKKESANKIRSKNLKESRLSEIDNGFFVLQVTSPLRLRLLISKNFAKKMENFNKRLELLTNVAIILVAVTLIGVVIYKVLPAAKPAPSEQLKAGSEFSLPDVNWAENKKTLVLVLQKGCHFCSDSASFYKTLAERNQNTDKVKLVAAFPNSVDEAKNYLSELGVAITDIRHFNFGKVIDGTPTLVLVDEQGKISEEEQAVFEKLNL